MLLIPAVNISYKRAKVEAEGERKEKKENEGSCDGHFITTSSEEESSKSSQQLARRQLTLSPVADNTYDASLALSSSASECVRC